MHMILDICAKEEENGEGMPVSSESVSLSACMDVYHDQTPSKDTETHVMGSRENNFHFIDQAARIKNEPETNTETGTTCQIQQNITKHSLDDSGASDASSDINTVKVSHIGSPRHETQTFNLPLRNQEMLTQHRIEPAQIRERQEIELLKRRLQQAGVQMDSETQACSSETQGQKYTQTFSEELRSEHVLKDTEMHMKLEVYTQPEDNEEVMPVCSESTSLSPCMDIYHDQTPSKDSKSQVMDSSENNFPNSNKAARIKNEPETNTETGTTCQIQQNITKHSLDDSGASDASSDINKVKVSHIGSPRHEIQTFNLPLRNQEMLTKHRMQLAQIRGRYQRRKSQGKVKFAKDLNPIELRRQQKKWRENSAAYRRKKAFQEVLVNIKEDINQVIPEPVPTTSSAQHYVNYNHSRKGTRGIRVKMRKFTE
ncbi:uncharacterized protein si:ch211-86h15.1 isoform X3 [Onychostoma macrolepis]|uniref:uncharacterized protein si:ch211-86h15.1 isoform X3 n=1 Tax=Onychostoma macrolepis TaxID=369639 RepID=UPI00272A80DB|nr:uncharacterized protein si:ch211-86h15.1 isoform X3 [Onychostoma macrolepis]